MVSRRPSFVLAVSFVAIVFLNLQPVQAATSNQSLPQAIHRILQNINLIYKVYNGEADIQTIGSTLVADTEAALEVYKTLNTAKITAIGTDLKKQGATKTTFTIINEIYANYIKLTGSNITKAAWASKFNLENAILDLKNLRQVLNRNVQLADKLSARLKGMHILGKSFNVLDTTLQVNTLVNAIKDDASAFETGIASSNVAISASITGLSFIATATKKVPVVGLVYVGKEIAVLYTDKLGNIVNLEVNERTIVIFDEIQYAKLRIENRIKGLYKASPPPTDEQVKTIAIEEYTNVKGFIESFRPDVGLAEWIFGQYRLSNESINTALNMVDNIIENRAEERAIEFNNKVRDEFNKKIREYNNAQNNLESEIVASKNAQVNVSGNRRLITLNTNTASELDGKNPPLTGQKTDLDTLTGEDVLTPPFSGTADPNNDINASIVVLRAQRNTYSITQQDADARLLERRNRLALLEFNDLGIVRSKSSEVSTRISELSTKQSNTGLSEADQQLSLDLVTYEDTLQTEQERIATDMTNTQIQIDDYENSLTNVNSQLTVNANSLAALGDDLSDYTPPTFLPQDLTDWTTYVYELPAFNEIDTGNNANPDDLSYYKEFPYRGIVGATVTNLEPGIIPGVILLHGSTLFTGLEGGGDPRPRQNPFVGGPQRGDARLIRGSTNTLYSHGLNPNIQVFVGPNTRQSYSYSDWGEWDGSGQTLSKYSNAQVGRGVWIIGETTHKDNLPTGTATYNGEVMGIAANDENIGGSVSLIADFNTQTVSGSFDLTRQDGSNWVTYKTGQMSYASSLVDYEYNNRFSHQVARLPVETPAGTTIGGAWAAVEGKFVGDRGQEVIGSWSVADVPDAVNNAFGVFRAKQ